MAKEQWRNKQAILRDLAKVTRGNVLVDINEAITDDRPPALNINEDTEEEYLRFCAGEQCTGTNTEGPDLHMISDMISMMQSLECKSKQEEEADNTPLQITKLSPQSSTPLISASPSSLSDHRISPTKAEELTIELSMKIQSQPKTVKAKRERNVALASLLKVYAGVAPIGYSTPNETSSQRPAASSPVKLLKPEDFTVTTKPLHTPRDSGDHISALFKPQKISSVNVALSKPQINVGKQDSASAAPVKLQTDSELVHALLEPPSNDDKVDRWLKQGSRSPKKGPMLSADAFRFKKSQKVSPMTVVKGPVHRASPTSRQYVPSPHADEIYRSILQQKEDFEAAQRLKEDIWQRAERQMQELEAKRQLEATAEEEIAAVVEALEAEEISMQPITVNLGNGIEKQIPAVLCLPQHRHKLNGTCLVCERCQSVASSKPSSEALAADTNVELEVESPNEPTKHLDGVPHAAQEDPYNTKQVISSITKKAITDWISGGKVKPHSTSARAEVVIGTNICNKNEITQDGPISKDAEKAAAKQDLALKLTNTCVPDFWEDLLLD